MAQGKVYIGTSGWHYRHWRGNFYPPQCAGSDFLDFYSRRLAAVEINNTFYHLPEKESLAALHRQTPDDFLFAVKASRFITHMKKLKGAAEHVDNFLERIAPLAEKTGPILFQLPPRWHCNVERLQEFISHLPGTHRYAFEFRDESWFTDSVYATLAKSNAAFCLYHLEGRMTPKEITADFVYIRLHGPGKAYEGDYATRDLAGWAGAISAWRRQDRDVYVFFDNDQNGYAPGNALELQNMLEK
ncbi:MAG: DUF72 domain-containing protein [Desulfurivibrionaceae bacterium]|nr:DUF72 domain-containing protein [Desulfurivibrionaceae bacterium]